MTNEQKQLIELDPKSETKINRHDVARMSDGAWVIKRYGSGEYVVRYDLGEAAEWVRP